uniref:Holin n=1 Tax=viral metagenome TaxID=1070528 RepID=A0A6M3JKB2_9ZZZZ
MEKYIAIITLGIIGIVVVFLTEVEGLDVVTNVVCTIGGLVTGNVLAKLEQGK